MQGVTENWEQDLVAAIGVIGGVLAAVVVVAIQALA